MCKIKTPLTVQFFGGLIEEFLCGGAHFPRHIEDVGFGFGANVFHQTNIVAGPLLLLSIERETIREFLITCCVIKSYTTACKDILTGQDLKISYM